MKKLIQYSIDHPLLVNLLTVFVWVAGLFAVARIHREAFPNVSYERVIIRTPYFGATPESIEKLITIPLERELKEVADIDEMRSVSLQGMSVIVVDIEPYAKNKDRVVSEIQRAVDQTADLPADLKDKPRVAEAKSKDQPILEVSLGGNLTETELVEYAKVLEKKFLDLPQVSAVARKGWREKEIWVEVHPQSLSDFSFSISDLVNHLARQNVNIPGGVVKEDAEEFLIRSSGEIETAKDVEEIVLRANDASHWIQIKDIAEVKDAFEEESLLQRTNGTRAINLVVIKKERADAIELVDQIKDLVAQYKTTVSDGVHISLVNDFSFFIRRRLNVLWSNGLFGLCLVICCLLLFMDSRFALMTALGVPFALLATFFTMQLAGITLNMITMFGLITVLGMLVDDAIVISENVYRHWKDGKPLCDACFTGTFEVWKPVASSVATTVAAFLPLMFMTGTIGKFVLYIPLMVMIALTASLFEAYFVLPSHLAEVERLSLRGPKRAVAISQKWMRLLRRVYTERSECARNDKPREFYLRTLKKSLRHRYKVAAGCVILFCFGIWLYFHIPFILFPARGLEIFFVRAEAPVGTPLEETAKRFETIEQLIATLPRKELKDYVLQVGIQQNDPHDPFTERFSHIGQLEVFLTPPSNRDRNAEEIVEGLREKVGTIDGFERIRFELKRAGPPVGKPIAIRVRGEDLLLLSQVAQEIKGHLATLEGVTDLKTDLEKGKNELSLKIDSVKAAQGSLSYQDIGQALRASFEGLVATTIKKTDEEIDIRVRFPKASQQSKENLSKVLIPNFKGDLIPLSQVAHFEETQGVNAIRHFNRERAITVLANVDEQKVTSVAVHQALKPYLAKWQQAHPNIAIQFGGEFEETLESFASLKQAFILGAFLIFIILAVQFNSLWQPFIVMTTIPLGLIGVLIAFWIHGEPKSFLGLMGMVGLAGVVVNNAIVLVDFMNEARKSGMSPYDSILKAGELRLRPVFLTSITTFFGLISLAYGFWGSDPFLKPMALAFVWGIAFATILTLIVVPCLHAIADDLRLKVFRRRSER